jgi:hypothetical protein
MRKVRAMLKCKSGETGFFYVEELEDQEKVLYYPQSLITNHPFEHHSINVKLIDIKKSVPVYVEESKENNCQVVKLFN